MSTNYMEKVLRTQSSSFIGYWPLNEESGTAVYNIATPQIPGASGNNNGTSTGLLRSNLRRGFLGPDGGKCAQFDGSASVIDMISAKSSSATTVGSLSIWAATPEANLSATTKMVLFHFAVDANNLLQLQFDTTAYRFTAWHEGNTTEKKVTSSLVYNVDGGQQFPEWHHFGFDYTDGGSLRFYVDGLAQTPATSLGTWSGNFATALMCLGSDHTTPSDQYKGYLAHFAWWHVVLSASEWKSLAEAGP